MEFVTVWVLMFVISWSGPVDFATGRAVAVFPTEEKCAARLPLLLEEEPDIDWICDSATLYGGLE